MLSCGYKLKNAPTDGQFFSRKPKRKCHLAVDQKAKRTVYTVGVRSRAPTGTVLDAFIKLSPDDVEIGKRKNQMSPGG